VQQRLTRRRRRPTLVLALSGLLLLVACAEEPLPQRRLSADDCLTDVQINRLEKALKRCDRVVAAFPNDPQPLNERFLLHSLKGDEKAACRDIRKAALLAGRIPPARLDHLLRRDLDLRVASCRDRPGTQAEPASASPPMPPAAAGR
jgi:hypothetical protein